MTPYRLQNCGGGVTSSGMRIENNRSLRSTIRDRDQEVSYLCTQDSWSTMHRQNSRLEGAHPVARKCYEEFFTISVVYITSFDHCTPQVTNHPAGSTEHTVLRWGSIVHHRHIRSASVSDSINFRTCDICECKSSFTIPPGKQRKLILFIGEELATTH